MADTRTEELKNYDSQEPHKPQEPPELELTKL
jgi:hypothetical protein